MEEPNFLECFISSLPIATHYASCQLVGTTVFTAEERRFNTTGRDPSGMVGSSGTPIASDRAAHAVGPLFDGAGLRRVFESNHGTKLAKA